MVTRVSQVTLVVGILAGLGLAGCDSPARVKPWRHAPDPTTEPGNHVPSSPALADMSANAELRAARAHTLRVHVDAEPGRLNPLVGLAGAAPAVWARRITLGTVFETLLRYSPAPADRPNEP